MSDEQGRAHLIGLDLHGAQYVHGQVATFGQYAAEQVLGTDARRTVRSIPSLSAAHGLAYLIISI